MSEKEDFINKNFEDFLSDDNKVIVDSTTNLSNTNDKKTNEINNFDDFLNLDCKSSSVNSTDPAFGNSSNVMDDFENFLSTNSDSVNNANTTSQNLNDLGDLLGLDNPPNNAAITDPSVGLKTSISMNEFEDFLGLDVTGSSNGNNPDTASSTVTTTSAVNKSVDITDDFLSWLDDDAPPAKGF